MNPAYRIFKLKTGEEIITKIISKNNGRFTLEYPMVFKIMYMSEPMTGMQKEVTILKDWVSFSNEKQVKLSENEVLSICTPVDEAINLYDKEKTKKLNPKKRNVVNFDNYEKTMQDEIDSLLDSLIQKKQEESEGEDIFDFVNSIKNLPEDGGYEIEMEWIFPSEEISDESTEKENDHPDYGNRWTDWSSDTRNY